MLAKRIIPVMLVRGRQLIKGTQFNSWRNVGHVMQAARIHAARGVDELMILDIEATKEGRIPDLGLIEELSEGCFIPITVGGGIRSVEHIDALLRAGADKVAICTALAEDASLLHSASDRFGAQAIVGVVEYHSDLGPCVTRRNGKIHLVGANPIRPADWARHLASAGAGEILLTSVERDGMMQGYDLDLIKTVSAAVDVPVIAAGGCGTPEHMLQAFQAGADACASGAMFQFTDSTPKGAAQYLKQAGVEVRL
jgi:cyclase